MSASVQWSRPMPWETDAADDDTGHDMPGVYLCAA